jgi:hypothetical protein
MVHLYLCISDQILGEYEKTLPLLQSPNGC